MHWLKWTVITLRILCYVNENWFDLMLLAFVYNQLHYKYPVQLYSRAPVVYEIGKMQDVCVCVCVCVCLCVSVCVRLGVCLCTSLCEGWLPFALTFIFN